MGKAIIYGYIGYKGLVGFYGVLHFSCRNFGVDKRSWYLGKM
jgi:hypothetical protein